MKKHLKISGEPAGPDFMKVKVTVLEQSHFGDEFGIAGTGSKYSHGFVHGGLYLGSANPEVKYWETALPSAADHTHRFYVKQHNLSDNSCEVPAEVWPKIRAAVEKYNEYFSAPEKEVRHIKYKAYHGGKDKVSVQILEQTHRGFRYNHGDFKLISNLYPSSGGWVGETSTCVRGTSEHLDDTVIILHVNTFEKFRDAVSAYNQEYAAEGVCIKTEGVLQRDLSVIYG